jgi:hypothetical protein
MNCPNDRYFNNANIDASKSCFMCNGGDPSKNDTDYYNRTTG